MRGKAKRLAGATVSFLGLIVAFALVTGAHAQGTCGGALTDWSDGNTTWQVSYANTQGALVTVTITLGASSAATISPAAQNGTTTGSYYMGGGYIFAQFIGAPTQNTTSSTPTESISFGSPVCVAGGTMATGASNVAVTMNNGASASASANLGTGTAMRLTP
jgi:hypothetical protein